MIILILRTNIIKLIFIEFYNYILLLNTSIFRVIHFMMPSNDFDIDMIIKTNTLSGQKYKNMRVHIVDGSGLKSSCDYHELTLNKSSCLQLCHINLII